MSTLPPWCNGLAEIVGAAQVVTDGAALAAAAVQGVKPACVCVPGNAEQASAVLKFAAEHKIPVVPGGGGTKQGIGLPPPAEFLALSTRGLGGVEDPAHHELRHEPPDMIATVPAGMELSAAQAALGRNGQWLPLDGDPHATVGGLVAADSSGPRALGYGTLRDMVLGMTIVNGDGVIRRCGGKVVKNVTGYALEKLYIGSFGTLGLITEVTFRLRPLPIERRWGLCGPLSAAECPAQLHAVAALNLPLEMLRGCGVLVPPSGDGPAIPWSFEVSATGAPAELDRIKDELSRVLHERLVSFDTLPTDWHDEGFPRTPRPEAAQPRGELRFWCAHSQLGGVLGALQGSHGHVRFGVDSGLAAMSLTEARVVEVSTALAKLGANFRWENVHGLRVEQPFGPPRPEWALMTQLKAALDPQGIMNPGRYVV